MKRNREQVVTHDLLKVTLHSPFFIHPFEEFLLDATGLQTTACDAPA